MYYLKKWRSKIIIVDELIALISKYQLICNVYNNYVWFFKPHSLCIKGIFA